MLVLLAPLGTLAAHGLAYWWQGGGDGLHGYLHVLGLPLMAALAVCWIVAAPQARSTALPPVRALVAAQIGVYACQETLERVAGHHDLQDVAGQLVGTPAVRAGVALQLVVAVIGLAVLRVARDVVGRAVTFAWPRHAATRHRTMRATVLRAVDQFPRSVRPQTNVSSRAPPFGFVH